MTRGKTAGSRRLQIEVLGATELGAKLQIGFLLARQSLPSCSSAILPPAFIELEKPNNHDSPLLGTHSRPTHYNINNFNPHHNPVSSVSQITFYRKGN